MKKTLTLLGWIGIATLLFSGCGSDKSADDVLIIDKEIERIAIDTPVLSAVSDLKGLELICRVYYDNNTSADATGMLAWTSSDKEIAAVSSGLVSMTSQEGGDVNITTSYGPFSDTLLVNVYALSDINVSIDYNGTILENNATVLVSDSYPMTAMGTFTNMKTDTNETPVTITEDVIWLSSDTTIATVDSAGLLSTLDVNGTIVVTAFALDRNGTIDINVSLP